MLTRKPAIGETLIYDTTAHGKAAKPREFTVTRFDGNLMYYLDDKGQPDGPIIWRFTEGLNIFLFHQPAA